MKYLCIVGSLLLAVVGCGQKGPLYLPKKTTSSASAPAPVSPDASDEVSDTGTKTPEQQLEKESEQSKNKIQK